VTLGLFAAIAGLALVPTPVLRGIQDIGNITMYLWTAAKIYIAIPYLLQILLSLRDNLPMILLSTLLIHSQAKITCRY
jgi:hypothetical protein